MVAQIRTKVFFSDSSPPLPPESCGYDFVLGGERRGVTGRWRRNRFPAAALLASGPPLGLEERSAGWRSVGATHVGLRHGFLCV